MLNKRLAMCLLGLITGTLFADHEQVINNPSSMFVQVKSGYAWSRDVTIHNATVANNWDASVEGYNASLTDSPFIEFAIGGYSLSFLDIALSYAYYETIHYQKYQTGISTTEGFTGSHRMRFFDIDHQNILANLILHIPKDTFSFTCNSVTVFPFIGGAVGVGFYEISNFHTVAYSDNVGSDTSIGNRVNNVSFAWEANVGITLLAFQDKLAFDIGYNYYDGGHFKTSNEVMVNTSSFQGANSASVPWKGSFRANELFFSFRFNF